MDTVSRSLGRPGGVRGRRRLQVTLHLMGQQRPHDGGVNAGVVRDTGPFWRALLVCPQCRAALLRHGTLAGCPACGARFGADGDTPDLRTGALARRYSLSFSEASWDEADHV